MTKRSSRFYSRRDWLAGAITGVVAFAGYVWTLAPSVTLEESGELVTAAHGLGVSRPPGYPIWTIVAWIWSHIIPFGNIAWRLNLMSAFFGALACGLLALLVSNSGRTICGRVRFFRADMKQREVDLVVLSSSICAGLLLAFSPALWSQTVITEVYGLNAFLLVVTLVVLYRWSAEPEKRGRLYLTAFVWGVALTAHQTLLLLIVALPMFVWLTDRKLGRDLLVPLLLAIIGLILWTAFQPGGRFHEGAFSATVLSAIGLGCVIWLYFLWREGPALMQQWRQVLAVYGAVLLGLALYGYLFLAASTNPPMNWGYCSRWESFLRHFLDSQFDRIHIERSALQLWGQIDLLINDLLAQFNLVFTTLALLILFLFQDLDARDRNWMKFLAASFLCLGLGFILLSNPSFEKQKQFTDRVFFVPGHCLYALGIGYGLMLGLLYVFSKKPAWQPAAAVTAVVVLLLPTVSFWRNWADQEERGHDFGYRFGYYMFKPGGEYPDMERNAILFGGTDPGRFVPTYMIFVESSVPPSTRTRSPKCPDSATLDRRDVYILTQNALADPTYLDYIRDQYDFSRPRLDDPNSLTNRSSFFRWLNRLAWNTLGRSMAYPKAPIWTPSHRDSLRALQQYIQDLRSRPPLPGEEVRIEGGKVSVQGVAGVMAINGILTKEIFDHNKDTHAFYVEESYVIPWMYPYLEPYGIILKLNREPLAELTPAMVERDTKYWDALFHDLDADPRFHRDDVAQKTFSKLRSAIGGLYASRRMFPEAEYAFQQAITLCPDSPEANFRLAKLYVDLGRFDDANKVLQLYQKRDPSDLRIRVAASQIQEIRRSVEMIHDLERQLQSQPNNVSLAMRLARLYTARQQVDRLDRLVNQLVASPDLTQNDFLQLANLYVPLNRSDRVVTMLMLFVQRYPQSPVGWYNLAVVQSLENNCAEALPALERALTLDNPDQQVRRFARDDPKLDNCRQDPRFLRLLQSIDNTGSTNLLPFTITR